MVISINGLALPPSLNGTAELVADDTSRRTVSMRLVTKLSAAEKWRIEVDFDDVALAPSFHAAFYAACAAMRSTAGEIVFVSPYSGEELTISARCVSRAQPKPVGLRGGRPTYYTGAGAVFEQI